MNESAGDQFKNEVRRVIKEKKLMVKQVALSARPPIAPGTMSRMLRGTKGQNLHTVQRIAEALGCEVVLTLRDKKRELDFQI